MPLETENRVFASGVVLVPGGVPAWSGRHPGFNVAIVDGGVGLFTVTLSGEVPAGGAIVRASVLGALGGFVQQITAGPVNTRAIALAVLDDAGMAADLPFSITVETIPAQA